MCKTKKKPRKGIHLSWSLIIQSFSLNDPTWFSKSLVHILLALGYQDSRIVRVSEFTSLFDDGRMSVRRISTKRRVRRCSGSLNNGVKYSARWSFITHRGKRTPFSCRRTLIAGKKKKKKDMCLVLPLHRSTIGEWRGYSLRLKLITKSWREYQFINCQLDPRMNLLTVQRR